VAAGLQGCPGCHLEIREQLLRENKCVFGCAGNKYRNLKIRSGLQQVAEGLLLVGVNLFEVRC